MASKADIEGPSPSTEVRPLDQEKHVSTDISSSQSDGPTEDFKIRWKVTAVILGVMLSWGSSFSENTLGPLKSTFIKQLGINNAQVETPLFQYLLEVIC